MYLIFDTETTGLPKYDLPPEDPTNARVVQLACALLDDKLEEVSTFATRIKPDGWTISAGAQGAHGLSDEDCKEYGMEIEKALQIFEHMLDNADYVVAHNFKFDAHLLLTEQMLLGKVPHKVLANGAGICTMLLTTDICKLKGKIPGRHKWPKLEEAHQHFFNEPMKNAHDALGDVRATMRIFKHLLRNNLITLPSGT